MFKNNITSRIEVSGNEWSRFKSKCARLEMSIQKALGLLVKMFLKGEIKL
jgi:hypothetical protein